MSIRKVLFGIAVLALFVVSLTACAASGDLPKPPVGGGAPPAATMPQANMPAMPSGGAMPTMSGQMPSQPTAPAAPTPDWQTVKSQSNQIQHQAQQVQPAFQQIADDAAQIKQNETDPDVVSLASQIADLAAQAEQDAAQIAVTANDINYRIDHSEATTLRLSDDIGKMADRIGEMADRILWTEGQIGVMADRIVHSEHLINNGTQQTIDQIQETLKQITDWTNDMAAQAAAIKRETEPPQAGGGQGQSNGGNAGNGGNSGGAGGNGDESGSGASGSSGGSGGAIAGGAGASGGAATAQPPERSVRRLEVLSGTIALEADSLQKRLQSAKEDALALNQDDLANALTRAQAAAAQISLTASDLNARAKVADELTPQLAQQGRQAKAQIDASLQTLTNALTQAQAAAKNLPTGDAKAKSIRRTLEAATISTEYMGSWNTEIGRIVQ